MVVFIYMNNVDTLFDVIEFCHEKISFYFFITCFYAVCVFQGEFLDEKNYLLDSIFFISCENVFKTKEDIDTK